MPYNRELLFTDFHGRHVRVELYRGLTVFSFDFRRTDFSINNTSTNTLLTELCT
jgi:hypothetical protein